MGAAAIPRERSPKRESGLSLGVSSWTRIADNTMQTNRRLGANQAWFEYMPADIPFSFEAGQGITNILIGLAGGLPSAGTAPRTESAIQAGARLVAIIVFSCLRRSPQNRELKNT